MGIRKCLNRWNKAAWCRMTLWSRSERTFVKVLFANILGIKLKKKIHHLWCYWSVGDLKLQNALDNDIFYQPKPTQTKYDIYTGCTYTESCVAKGNRVVQHFCIRAAGGGHSRGKEEPNVWHSWQSSWLCKVAAAAALWLKMNQCLLQFGRCGGKKWFR